MRTQSTYYKTTNREKLLRILKENFSHTNNFKTILVGGTNGKGSTSTFLQQHLRKHKVGLFTSPHLMYTNERIRINDALITSSEIGEICSKYVDVFTKNDLSFYEIMLFIALEHFSRKKVEYAILEIGIGGEFDACNIVEPIYSVLTSISMDHENVLGRTLKKIVATKSKIGRIGRLLFINKNESEYIKRLVKENSFKNGSKLQEIRTDEYKKLVSSTLKNKRFFLNWPSHIFENLAYSIGIAVRIGVSLKDIISNLENIRKPFARMTHSNYNGRELLVDGCHNYKSVKSMIDNLNRKQKYDVIFVSKRGKAYMKELALLLFSKKTSHISLSNFGSGFVNWTRPFLPLNGEKSKLICVYSNWKLALEATINSERNTSIILCGSLYFAGNVQRELNLFEKNDYSPEEIKLKFLK